MAPKKKYTEPLRSILKGGGLWFVFPDEELGRTKTSFQILRYVFCLGVWVLTCCTVFKSGTQFLFTPPGIFLPLGGVLHAATIIIIFQRKKLEYLLDQCEANLSSYKRKWEIEIVESNMKKTALFLYVIKFGLIGFLSFYVAFPLVVDGMRFMLGYSEPYYLPMPLEGYLEKNTTRSPFYYMIIFTCDLWFLEAMSLTNAFEVVLLSIVSYNITEFKILKTCVQKLQPEANEDGVMPLPPWNLKRIIRYHRKIIRLNILQNDCITSSYVVQNVLATLSFAFIMFLVRKVLGENNMLVFLAVTFIGMLTGLLFFVCFAGQLIHSESEELLGMVYNTSWYRQSPRIRRDVLLILTQLSKPLVLEYKTNVINLTAFMQMLNNSYSFLMLMLSFEST